MSQTPETPYKKPRSSSTKQSTLTRLTENKKRKQEEEESIKKLCGGEPAMANHTILQTEERVMRRLDELQGYIVRLHDMCLQAEQDECSEGEVALKKH